MACVARPRRPGSHGPSSGRHDAMARMRERREKVGSCNEGYGDCAPQRYRADREEEAYESAKLPLPTPRGGARGPAEARLARENPQMTSTAEEPLPAAAKGADFKTLQTLIAKGIQANEEDGVLLEASLGGAEWNSKDQAEEEKWRETQRKKRLAEEAAREKEKERAREQRRRQDEERRKRQMEELERELAEEKRLEAGRVADSDRKVAACRREFDAAARIQAHHRGRQSRAGRPIEAPPKTARWDMHTEEYIRRPA